MLKIENYEVMGLEHAIRGMRNPMNSWEQSDSVKCDVLKEITSENEKWRCAGCKNEPASEAKCYVIGPNDQKLMMNLRNAGTDHRKFMRMLTVYVDITAPLYWWKEFDTYKVGTVANSCSTMHKIHAKEFTPEDFSIDIPTEDDDLFLSREDVEDVTATVVKACECVRERYVHYDKMSKNETYTESERKKYKRAAKKYWRLLIQYMPISYNQKRTVMLNYEVLANIYKSRKNHKLDEWHVLCEWIEKLPYSELITGEPDFLRKKLNIPEVNNETNV